jgi:hypothetical protein
MDSIMRKYPIGIVLMWETYNNIQFRKFDKYFKDGDIYTFLDNDKETKRRLVLDGQQRLQSLYLALYGKHKDRALYFNVFSGQNTDNLAEEIFKFDFFTDNEAELKNASALQTTSIKRPGHDGAKENQIYFMRASDLFIMPTEEKIDLKNNLIEKYKLEKDDVKRLETNLSKFNEVFSQDENILKVSVIDENLHVRSPQRKTESDVLEIFVRINREGTPLSRSDLIFSMIKLNWKESANEMPEFVRKIREGNSLNIDADFVIRCLFAVSDLGTKFDIDLLRNKKNVEVLRKNYNMCCDAIKSAVDFVQEYCWCQNDRLIGGLFTLIPIVYYLSYQKKYEIPNDQLSNVRKAFFTFAFAKPFSRYADSRIGAYIRQYIKPLKDKKDDKYPLEKSIERVKYWEGTDNIEKLIDKNDLLTLHLVQGLKGQKIQYDGHAPEIDHIFPRSVLRDKEYSEELINHFANFWILAKSKNRNKSNQHPSQYFKDVDEKILKEALIDREMLDYRCFTTFIDKRKALMIAKVSEKIGLSDDDFKQEKIQLEESGT